MGAGQSYLNIYLESKDKVYEGEGYTVTPSKKISDESLNFEVVTHSITYKVADARYFDVYIYNNKGTPHDASYIFAYCSPWITSHVVNEVKAYYSILTPHIPLVISFVRGNKDTHNCEIDKLRSARWNKAAYITEYSSEKGVAELLNQQFTKLLWDRTIHFTTGSENENIMGRKQEINDNNYRFIFIPREYESSLGLQSLYGLDYNNYEPTTPEPQYSESKNQIDPYFLTSVNGEYYAGILVYFNRNGKPAGTSKEKDNENKVLLLEFIKPPNTKIQITRKDKDGYRWSQENVKYSDDASLIQALKGIKDNSEKEDINTVLIDKRDQYLGLSKFGYDGDTAYKKYTHEFANAYKPVFLFARKVTEITQLITPSFTTQNVEVYYLKTVTTEDTEPFLIVVKTNGGEKLKKCYHFKNTGKFKDWVEFTFKKGDQLLTGEALTEKLYEKLKQIQESGGCTPELHLLKKLALEILLAKDKDPPPKVIPPKDPERPDLHPKPPEPPEPLPLGWIITGSVGGTVFIIGSTVGYGVYWYNTTIRLLT